MKNKPYYILLLILTLLLVIIGLTFTLPWKYWTWSLGGIVLYIWCKDAFTGTKWFEKPVIIRERPLTPYQQKIADLSYEEYLASLPKVKQAENEGYLELTRLCVAENKQPELVKFFNEVKDFSEDDDYMTTLNYVMEYLDNNQITFILRLDWKAPVEELELCLHASLKENFNLSVTLPKEADYGERASVSYDNVFQDFDKPLRAHGLQMGFIDTQSDEYVIVLHKIADKKRVEEAVAKIGYGYTELQP